MKKLLYLILLILLSSCATSPTGRKQLMLVSPEQAIVASKDAYTQTLLPHAEKGLLDSNPVVSERVRVITGRIVSQAINQFPHTGSWGWSVKVIDERDTVNAWCMAGGKMAIYTGFLEKVKPTDDELAQVMAHEVSHALANHTAEKMSVAMASQLGLMGVALAVGNSDYAGLALTGSALAAALAIQLPNSRGAEVEADRMGIELAARAGYDPRSAVTLWKKMGEVGGDTPPQFLSTHPSPYNRQQKLGEIVEEMMPYYLEKVERPVYIFTDTP